MFLYISLRLSNLGRGKIIITLFTKMIFIKNGNKNCASRYFLILEMGAVFNGPVKIYYRVLRRPKCVRYIVLKCQTCYPDSKLCNNSIKCVIQYYIYVLSGAGTCFTLLYPKYAIQWWKYVYYEKNWYQVGNFLLGFEATDPSASAFTPTKNHIRNSL